MPVATCGNYEPSALAELVAKIEADGGTVKQVLSVGNTWTVLYDERKKPGPKPKVETR